MEENFRPSSTEFVSLSDAVPGLAVVSQNDTGVEVPAGFTMMLAVAYFVLSATLVARTVTVCCAETDDGAV